MDKNTKQLSPVERKQTAAMFYALAPLVSKIVAISFFIFTVASVFIFHGTTLFIVASFGVISCSFSRVMVYSVLKKCFTDDIKALGPNHTEGDFWNQGLDNINTALDVLRPKAVVRSCYWIIVFFGAAYAVSIVYILAALAILFILFRFNKETNQKTVQ